MTITTRATTYPGVTNKAAALTNAELDGNFTDILDKTRQVAASAHTTIDATDAGKCLEVTGTVIIPNSVMSAGDVVSIFNNSASPITLTASITTLYLAGMASTGNRTLAQRGLASIRFISGTVAVIAGAGLT